MEDYSVEVDAAIMNNNWKSYEKSLKDNEMKVIKKEIYRDISKELDYERESTEFVE